MDTGACSSSISLISLCPCPGRGVHSSSVITAGPPVNYPCTRVQEFKAVHSQTWSHQ